MNGMEFLISSPSHPTQNYSNRLSMGVRVGRGEHGKVVCFGAFTAMEHKQTGGRNMTG
jgi:hypothetical protein